MKAQLGKIYAEFERGRNNKWYRYRNWWLFGLLIVYGVTLTMLPSLFFGPDEISHNNPLTIPILILLTQFIVQYRPFSIGENGFTDGVHFIPWKDIREIEWDRDLGQEEWMFRVYFTTNAAPFKSQLSREFQPQADELFKKFLKAEKTHTHVYA